jgi:fermentation-respiration switch protein FrsA (DUF1100 family)
MERRLRFNVEGAHLAATLHLPDGLRPGERRPGIVLCNTFAAVKEMVLPAIARGLARAGFAALAFDYRSFGDSDGEPRCALRPWDQVEDARSAVTCLQQQPEVDPDVVGIFGAGLGGGVAIAAAAGDPRVTAVAALAPVGDGERWLRTLRAEGQWSALRRRLTLDRRQRARTGYSEYVHALAAAGFAVIPCDDAALAFVERCYAVMPSLRRQVTLASAEAIADFVPEALAGRISPRPLLLMAAPGDCLVPVREADALFRAAREPRTIAYLPSGLIASHYDLYGEPAVSAVLRTLIDWLEARWAVAGPTRAAAEAAAASEGGEALRGSESEAGAAGAERAPRSPAAEPDHRVAEIPAAQVGAAPGTFAATVSAPQDAAGAEVAAPGEGGREAAATAAVPEGSMPEFAAGEPQLPERDAGAGAAAPAASSGAPAAMTAAVAAEAPVPPTSALETAPAARGAVASEGPTQATASPEGVTSQASGSGTEGAAGSATPARPATEGISAAVISAPSPGHADPAAATAAAVTPASATSQAFAPEDAGAAEASPDRGAPTPMPVEAAASAPPRGPASEVVAAAETRVTDTPAGHDDTVEAPDRAGTAIPEDAGSPVPTPGVAAASEVPAPRAGGDAARATDDAGTAGGATAYGGEAAGAPGWEPAAAHTATEAAAAPTVRAEGAAPEVAAAADPTAASGPATAAGCTVAPTDAPGTAPTTDAGMTAGDGPAPRDGNPQEAAPPMAVAAEVPPEAAMSSTAAAGTSTVPAADSPDARAGVDLGAVPGAAPPSQEVSAAAGSTLASAPAPAGVAPAGEPWSAAMAVPAAPTPPSVGSAPEAVGEQRGSPTDTDPAAPSHPTPEPAAAGPAAVPGPQGSGEPPSGRSAFEIGDAASAAAAAAIPTATTREVTAGASEDAPASDGEGVTTDLVTTHEVKEASPAEPQDSPRPAPAPRPWWSAGGLADPEDRPWPPRPWGWGGWFGL